MKAKIVKTTQRHEDMRLELVNVMKKYGDLPAIELLCIVSHLVGQLVAMQNQFEFTPEVVMAHVSENIKAGNQSAIAEIMSAKGGNA